MQSMLTGLLSKHKIFHLFTLSVVLIMVLPDLLRHGMFMDGTQYAIVSKNLANGISTFWLPFLSNAWEKQGVNYFLEHPPLVYYLQSKFFVLFNNGFFSERAYCLTTLFVCAFLIYKIWKLIFEKEKSLQNYWWLAVLFWISIPSVSWAFKNNMQENTLSVFVLASTYFALKSIYSTNGFLYIVISALCVFLATLSKGLPGFFPISILVVFYFFNTKLSLKKTIYYTGILFVLPLLLYTVIYFTNEEAKFSLSFYLTHRLTDRIINSSEVQNRFTILFWLFTDTIVPIAIALIFLLIFKFKHFKMFLDTNLKKLILFFVTFGLMGIIPLTFTHVQRAVYFVPATPFIAFAFAIFFVKGIQNLVERLEPKNKPFKFFKVLTILVFGTTIFLAVFLYGKIGRDKGAFVEMDLIAKNIGSNQLIGTPFDVYGEWYFQFYLLRYYNISLDSHPEKKYDLKMFKREHMPKELSGLTEMKIGLTKHALFKVNN
jgi:4-amino-4-deoxy-L-arabinose transferase-like glycosyltransferase